MLALQDSPYHSCCSQGNLDAATPLLMFNSHDEFLDVSEPTQMYNLLAGTLQIPVTKVILRSAGHAFYHDRLVDTAEAGDRIDSANYPSVPGPPAIDLKTVEQATADFFLAQL